MHEFHSGHPRDRDATDGLTDPFNRDEGPGSFEDQGISIASTPSFPGTVPNRDTAYEQVEARHGARRADAADSAEDPAVRDADASETLDEAQDGLTRPRRRFAFPRRHRRERGVADLVSPEPNDPETIAESGSEPPRSVRRRLPNRPSLTRPARIGLAAMLSVTILVGVLIQRKVTQPGSSRNAEPAETLDGSESAGPELVGQPASTTGEDASLVSMTDGGRPERVPSPPIPLQASPGNAGLGSTAIPHEEEGTNHSGVEMAMLASELPVVPPRPTGVEGIDTVASNLREDTTGIVPPRPKYGAEPTFPQIPGGEDEQGADRSLQLDPGTSDPAGTTLAVDAVRSVTDANRRDPQSFDPAPESLGSSMVDLADPSAVLGDFLPPPNAEGVERQPVIANAGGVVGVIPEVLAPNAPEDPLSPAQPDQEIPTPAAEQAFNDPNTMGLGGTPPALVVTGGAFPGTDDLRPPPSDDLTRSRDGANGDSLSVGGDVLTSAAQNPTVSPTAAPPGPPDAELPAGSSHSEHSGAISVVDHPPTFPHLNAPPDLGFVADETNSSPGSPGLDPATALTPLPNRGMKGIPTQGPLGGRTTVPTVPMPRAAASTTRGGESRTGDAALEALPHVVQRGENFYTISRLYYGSGRYWKALWSANRDVSPQPADLVVGATVRVLPPEQLDPALIEPLEDQGSSDRRLAGRDENVSRAGDGSENQVLLPTATPQRLRPNSDALVSEELDSATRAYVVRSDYETLRSIARDALGDARRAEEILRMNRELLGERTELTPGMRLRLPAGPPRR